MLDNSPESRNNSAEYGDEKVQMNQPHVQATANSVTVEGFDEIYQPDQLDAQACPEQAQADPVVEIEMSLDQAQRDPEPLAQTDPALGVSLEEAAKVLGLHLDTVRKRLQKGKIRGFKVADKFGDKWFVHKDELNRGGLAQPCPTVQAQAAPELAQGDPVVEIEIGPDQAQRDPEPQSQTDPAHERLMSIIESQAHQLKAAGDVIVYLKSELEGTKTELKLLTDSQHNPGWWARFSGWFMGNGNKPGR